VRSSRICKFLLRACNLKIVKFISDIDRGINSDIFSALSTIGTLAPFFGSGIISVVVHVYLSTAIATFGDFMEVENVEEEFTI
jgi:hypothetical protein